MQCPSRCAPSSTSFLTTAWCLWSRRRAESLHQISQPNAALGALLHRKAVKMPGRWYGHCGPSLDMQPFLWHCRRMLRTVFIVLLTTGVVLLAAPSVAQTEPGTPAATPQRAADASVSPPTPKIAFTFDDLPAHGPLPPGESRLEVASKILAALHDVHMPQVFGFVNGARVEQPSDAAALQAWRDAGYPLGNHTWSTIDLYQ